MAGNAIVAKLQLDSKDYDKKLEQAKKKTNDFSKGGGAGLGDMVGKFKTLAVAVAGSKAAMEIFNRVINSSQTISDGYAKAVDGMKGAVNQFFYSIGSGDWTSFHNGLDNTIEKAKAVSVALDELGTYDIALGYFREEYQTGFRENVAVAKDAKKSDDERKAAAAAAANYAEEYVKALNGKEALVRDAFAKMLSSSSSNLDVSQINIEQFEAVLKDAVLKGNSAMYAEDYKEYEALAKKKKKMERELVDMKMSLQTIESSKKQAQLEKIWEQERRIGEMNMQMQAEKYVNAQMYNAALERWTDDEQKANLQILSGVKAGRREVAKMNTALIEVNNTMDKLGQTTSAVVGKTKELKLTYKEISMDAGVGLFAGITETHTPKKKEMPLVSASPIPDKIEGYAPTAVFAEGSYEAYVAAKDGLDSYTDSANSATEAIGALSSTMSSLSSIVGEDAAAWLDWGVGVAQAVAQAIPQIAALTASKSAEATANTASAATGAASSVASIPYVGPILAVAAVASVIAALANLPKFATGGVVPGNMLSGDNVLIRANSGEVVLNRDQQDILSKRLNGFGGNVEFRIKGDTLVGVLNNHNRIASRNYGG